MFAHPHSVAEAVDEVLTVAGLFDHVSGDLIQFSGRHPRFGSGLGG